MLSNAEFIRIIDKAVADFEGDFAELRGAVGTLAIGRKFGWKPIYLISHRITIQKYERILGISFRDVLPEQGPSASRSKAFRLAQDFSNFWEIVRGKVAGVKTPIIDSGRDGH